MLDGAGLIAEFVAPRLWEDPRTIDGGYTNNDPENRQYAIDRSLQAIDIATELGTNNIVLWLAREGTYIRESKNAREAHEWLLEAINRMLAHNPNVRILIEPKPNEPMDHAYLPTIGHAIAMAYLSEDPARVGGLIETAHAKLAGLDPSDEMAFALFHKKLWSVHLNDQNGLKFDEDKSFAAANLREAFNQVRVLEEAGYALHGEWVGLDVKAMRTQKDNAATRHLSNSREVFNCLVDISRSMDQAKVQAMVDARDYEELDMYVMSQFLSRK
jgi:xylose isomerase